MVTQLTILKKTLLLVVVLFEGEEIVLEALEAKVLDLADDSKDAQPLHSVFLGGTGDHSVVLTIDAELEEVAEVVVETSLTLLDPEVEDLCLFDVSEGQFCDAFTALAHLDHHDAAPEVGVHLHHGNFVLTAGHAWIVVAIPVTDLVADPPDLLRSYLCVLRMIGLDLVRLLYNELMVDFEPQLYLIYDKLCLFSSLFPHSRGVVYWLSLFLHTLLLLFFLTDVIMWCHPLQVNVLAVHFSNRAEHFDPLIPIDTCWCI